MVECNQLVCWDVVMIVPYSLDGIAGSFVVDTDLRVMLLGMDSSVVRCESCLEVKEIIY